jgi:hypothetical protein
MTRIAGMVEHRHHTTVGAISGDPLRRLSHDLLVSGSPFTVACPGLTIGVFCPAETRPHAQDQTAVVGGRSCGAKGEFAIYGIDSGQDIPAVPAIKGLDLPYTLLFGEDAIIRVEPTQFMVDTNSTFVGSGQVIEVIMALYTVRFDPFILARLRGKPSTTPEIRSVRVNPSEEQSRVPQMVPWTILSQL